MNIPVEQPTLRVLSLGAGVQSTVLLMLSAQGKLPLLDAAVFADTGWEPASVYEHLDRLEREVARPAGIPIHRVGTSNLRDDVLDPNKMRSIPAYTAGPWREQRDPIAKRCPEQCGWASFDPRDYYGGEPPEEVIPADCATCGNSGDVIVGYGEPYQTRDLGMLGRKCTQQYKLRPVLEQVRLLLGASTGTERPCTYCNGTGERVAPWRAKRGETEVGPCSVCENLGTISRVGQPPDSAWAEQWIGFSTDEITRVSNRGDTRYSRSRYPLLELNMSRTQCDAYLKHHGWTSVAKSACIGCPFHGNRAWRQMRDHDPKSWADAVAFDAEYRDGAGMEQQRFLHGSCLPLAQAPIDIVQRREHVESQPDIFDALYEASLEAEEGDPDGCSPWACRSGSPAA